MSVYIALGAGGGRAPRALEERNPVPLFRGYRPGALPGVPQNWGLSGPSLQRALQSYSSHSSGKPEFMAKNESSPVA